MIPQTSIIISINDTHGCFCAAAGLSEGWAAAGACGNWGYGVKGITDVGKGRKCATACVIGMRKSRLNNHLLNVDWAHTKSLFQCHYN